MTDLVKHLGHKLVPFLPELASVVLLLLQGACQPLHKKQVRQNFEIFSCNVGLSCLAGSAVVAGMCNSQVGTHEALASSAQQPELGLWVTPVLLQAGTAASCVGERIAPLNAQAGFGVPEVAACCSQAFSGGRPLSAMTLAPNLKTLIHSPATPPKSDCISCCLSRLWVH